LKVNDRVDERTDIHKSTHAAARYLTELFGTYKDWLLVIAAYNCGPGVVNSAIRKSGSRNFWNLQYFLPAESRNHVKKFIATHYIMEGDGGVTTLTKKETEQLAFTPLPENEKGIEYEETNITGRYNSVVIAQYTQMNISEFNSLNPNFDKALSASGSFNLRLPSEKLLVFLAKKPQILEQSIKVMLMMDGR
jgi:membrane-bound lytic murein transglycosylase D